MLLSLPFHFSSMEIPIVAPWVETHLAHETNMLLNISGLETGRCRYVTLCDGSRPSLVTGSVFAASLCGLLLLPVSLSASACKRIWTSFGEIDWMEIGELTDSSKNFLDIKTGLEWKIS